MKKYFLVFATLIAALGLFNQPAEAQRRTVVVTPAPVYWQPFGWWWSGQRDPAVATSTTIVGGAATGAYFAIKNSGGTFGGDAGAAYGISSFGCAVVSPIFTTWLVQRELTRREVWVMTANCAVPFVGGWFINSILDANPNPLWDK